MKIKSCRSYDRYAASTHGYQLALLIYRLEKLEEVLHVAMDFIVSGGVVDGLPGVCVFKTGGLLNGNFWSIDFDWLVLVMRGFRWRSGEAVMLESQFKKACILWKF